MLKWTLGYSETFEKYPERTIDITPYISAPDTPGEAQLIWHKAGKLPDYNFGSNVLEYRSCEDLFWVYSTEFEVEDREGFEPVIRFDCIDYKYTIKIDGKIYADDEGMFTPVEIALNEFIGKTIKLDCIIHPVPKVAGVPQSRSQARESVKPPVSYGWDWHPRLIPSGLSGAVKLLYLPKDRVDNLEITYELNDELSEVKVNISSLLKSTSQRTVIASVIDEDGNTAASGSLKAADGTHPAFELTVKNPKLWWCARQGDQYLYTVKVEIFNDDGEQIYERSKLVGFRRVKLVMNENSWERGVPIPQGDSPYTIMLNGRKIFAKGSNFVSADIFYSKVTAENYEQLISLALGANMNIFRMWGGSPVQKEEFFELCDKLGMMIWQEFPLACNDYPDKAHYLEMLEKEAVSIVKRLREHPSVVLWCGGNELFNSWSGMSNQSLALRVLDRVTLTYDRWTPYIMTSPVCGAAHGPYVNIIDDSNGTEAITRMTESDHTAYTEFGCPGPAPYDYLTKYMTKDDLDSFFGLQLFDKNGKTHGGLAELDESLKNPWFLHHAIKAHYPYDTWFRINEIYRYFHKTESLEECCELGQIIQGACYKVMFEQARLKWGRTAMAINWDYNEPWPCFAGNSLIAYPNVIKPAYFDVKAALRDRKMSIKLDHLRFAVDEEAELGIYVLNDLPTKMSGSKYSVLLEYDDENETVSELMSGHFDDIKPTSVTKVGVLNFKVPKDISKTFRLTLKCENDELSESYTIFRKDQE